MRKETAGDATGSGLTTRGRTGVSTIEFRHLSLQEAEEVLVDVWNCLEEYGIPSPQMAFDDVDKTAVSFRLRFGEPLWARLVANHLSNGMIARTGRAAGEGRSGETIGHYLLISETQKSSSPGADRLS
jgi:hypothetical protein